MPETYEQKRAQEARTCRELRRQLKRRKEIICLDPRTHFLAVREALALTCACYPHPLGKITKGY